MFLAISVVLKISDSSPKTTSFLSGIMLVTNTGFPRAIPRPFL